MSEFESLDEQQKLTIQELSVPLESRHAAEVEAVVAGYLELDILPASLPDMTLAPGHLLEAGDALLSPAGPVANTGLALHKLGVPTRLLGKVGNDTFGQALLRMLTTHGTDLAENIQIAAAAFTSYAIILRLPKKEAVIIRAPGCNETFLADDVRYDMLETVGLFHFGCPPQMARLHQDNGSALIEMFQRARSRGVTTSLDFSLPDPDGQTDWQAFLTALLPFVDVFLPSIEEMLFVLRRPLFDKLTAKAGHGSLLDLVTPDVVSELGQTLLQLGARIVALKAGHRGLYLCTAESTLLEQSGRAQPTKPVIWAKRELWAPCFATEAVDRTGSGDATVAGFLLGLMRGMTPSSALTAACAVGASNVEADDALSGIKSWPETMERIAAGWPRLLANAKGRPALDMAKYGWRWNETLELWLGPRDAQR